MILDCETGTSTMKSLCNIFSCDEIRMEDTILCANNMNDSCIQDQLFYEHVCEKLGKPKTLNYINWFHGTRTTSNNKFKEGILTLQESFPTIWKMILGVVEESSEEHYNLKAMHDKGVNHWGLNARINNLSCHDGPYGYLIKEFCTKQHYLKMPELITDICNAYKTKYGKSILGIYEQTLVPKIVKFRNPPSPDSKEIIGTAIHYAYKFLKKEAINKDACSMAVSFEGEKNISPENILSTEIINDLQDMEESDVALKEISYSLCIKLHPNVSILDKA